MTAIIAKSLMDHLPAAFQGLSAPSWGVTEASKLAENRIKSMQRLTAGTVADIRNVADSILKPRQVSMDQQLSAKLASLKKILSAVSMYLDHEWRTQLLSTLDRFLDPTDWEEDLLLPSEESFATFLRTVIYLHPTKRPGLGLSAKGNFLASWRRDRDRIVIEFLRKDGLRWVLSQTMNGSPESGAGINPIHRLPDLIAGYEPDRFFHDGEKLLT